MMPSVRSAREVRLTWSLFWNYKEMHRSERSII